MNFHRTASVSRATSMVFAAVAAVCCMLASPFADFAHADDESSFIGVVTADNVFVRSGPADSYYPIGRTKAGDLVKVVGERFGWARIHSNGPTFERKEFFGYIIYPKTQPGRFRLASDGKTGRTLGRTDVLAPNLNTEFNPNDSWKPLIRLEAETDVRVIETLESANNIVQKISLPDEAEVWISMRFIERADEQQLAAWKRHFSPDEETPARPLARDEQPAPQIQPLDQQREQDRQRAERQAEEALAAERREHEREVERERELAYQREIEGARAAEQAAAARDDDVQEQDEVDESDEIAEPADHEPTAGERLAQATLDDLEAAFELLRKEPIETAEVVPLRRMYLDLADRATEERERRFAFQRAEQLEIWSELQQNRQRLARLRSRAELTGERVEAARRAVDEAGDYTAVGRLAVSTIYDGRRLPQLLRLQEPGTGRTVAYVQPSDEYDLFGMIGHLIGVLGERQYDGGLRLNLISPRRVDILAPQD
jgi:flagellar motor protein MotB